MARTRTTADHGIIFSDSELQVISHALQTAAEKYRECAATISNSNFPAEAKRRLVEQFDRQAADCAKLDAKIVC